MGDAIESTDRRRVLTRQAVAVAVAAGVGAYLLWLVVDPEPTVGRDLVLYTALLSGCAGLILLRGLTDARDRGAWLLLAAGTTVWLGADAWYTGVVVPATQPFPTAADVGYLLFFPLAYSAVGLLAVAQVGAKALGVWLDGLLVALAAGAYLSLMAPAIAAGLSGSAWAVFLGFATPVSDLLLLAGLAGVVGLLGRRAGPMWWALLAAAGVLWATDSLWLVGVMNTDYRVGTILDVG